MVKVGPILKMRTTLKNPIEYELPIGDEIFEMNAIIGKYIRFEWQKEIFCIRCGRKINKTFAQGYCYPCFLQSPQTSECIFKPHLCKAHLGESRDMEWSKKNCLTDTYVYLSLTSLLFSLNLDPSKP